jgi:acyl-CoA dehydrogenase
VFVPVDFIIGGRERAGQGWQMLMDSLAAGRSISLPSLATGASQLAARVAGAYASVREQFGLPIGRFEGVQEPLARIGGRTYLVSAARRITAGAVDAGEKPAVVSAIVKAYLTEFMRQNINDASDIQAGAAICQGPRNTLGSAYRALPIGITVEGANILTRSLIIYGQGAIRCHPYVQREIHAVETRDLAEFDEAFFGHVGLVFQNAFRAWFLGVTGCRWAGTPHRGRLAHHFGRFSRYSAAFTFLSDVAMGTLGGRIKRMEHLSGRMADALAWMYLGSVTLKRYTDEGQSEVDRPFADWGCRVAEHRIEQAMNGILDNFPIRAVALAVRPVLFPWGVRRRYPSDRLGARVARQLLDGREGRERLTRNIYIPGASEPGLGRLEAALTKVVAARAPAQKIVQAARQHRIPKGTQNEMAQAALEAGIITEEEHQTVLEAVRAREDAIEVDAFDPEVLLRPGVVETLERVSPGAG